MMQYYYHNPNTIFIGSAYREDAEEFEKELHACVQAQVLNEWYPAEMLNQMIEYITGVTAIPKKIPKYVLTKTKPQKVTNTTLIHQTFVNFITINPKGDYQSYCNSVLPKLQYSLDQFENMKREVQLLEGTLDFIDVVEKIIDLQYVNDMLELDLENYLYFIDNL